MGVVAPVPALLLAGMVWLDHRADSWCDAQIASSAWAPEWEHRGPIKAALIGDSWAVGDGENPAFPGLVAEALDLDLRVSAVGGTGYLNEGPCGGQPFAARVDTIPADAEWVILAGGVNDTGRPDDIHTAVDDLIEAVRERAPEAKVVVLGVPRVRLVPSDATEQADGVLQHVDADAFVDVRVEEVEIGADDIHPTPAGQRQYADLIVDALR